MEIEICFVYIKHDLGLVLGIKPHKTKAMMDSSTFLDDVITAWLRGEDQVKKKGEPSWTVLVRALEHPRVGQCGTLEKIKDWVSVLGHHRNFLPICAVHFSAVLK